MRLRVIGLGMAAVGVLGLAPLFADAKKAEDPSHLMAGLGVFDVCGNHPHFQYELEYRREIHRYHLRPLIGISGTTKGSIYLYGGVGYDIFLGDYFVLTPSFAPGLYFRSKGKDLGCVLEFRSSIEFAFIFKNKARLGAQFYHVSNASLGYKNPGEESLILFYAFPLN